MYGARCKQLPLCLLILGQKINFSLLSKSALMNFLAHIFLSGDNKLLMLGNFMADHIKGKAIDGLGEELKNGVILHRKIDHFTDTHSVVQATKERLRPVFRKYAPVVADVFYDHFLASKWISYSQIPLGVFADNFYKTATQHQHMLPEKTRMMLPYMISNNWLVSYASVEGIGKVMSGMARRAKFESGMEKSAKELEKNYLLYEKEFDVFFEELLKYTNEEISVLKSRHYS